MSPDRIMLEPRVKKFLPAALLSTALMCVAAPTSAHHSAAQFNFQTPVSVKGVIKEFRMANPHMRLVLAVEDEKGAREIEYEGHSLNNLYRRGWRKDMMKVGDTITISIAPRKDGGDGGYVLSVRTADGKEF